MGAQSVAECCGLPDKWRLALGVPRRRNLVPLVEARRQTLCTALEAHVALLKTMPTISLGIVRVARVGRHKVGAGESRVLLGGGAAGIEGGRGVGGIL